MIGQFKNLLVAGFADDDRNLGNRGQAGGAPAAFSCDDLVGCGSGPANQNWLNDAFAFDRLGQFEECSLIKFPARLVGIRSDLGNRNLNGPIAGRFRR